MRPVYLGGRGLVCALGPDLPSALSRLAAGGVEPSPLRLGPEQIWPCFRIAETAGDWFERARAQVRRAVAECDPAERSAPLFLASCSMNIGAVEDALPHGPECFDFGEEVAAWLDWQGPVYWISTACTSASNALLAASRLIACGEADEAMVLGLELSNRFSCGGFAAMQLLDTRRPRPLAADRAGLVLGEAVAAIRLSARPARWRLAGGANRVDGRDPAGASATAVHAMCEAALADAGLTPADIDLIKLQAAGSPSNDAVEIEGLRACFGNLPALTTLKAELGHTLGAAAAAELALLTASLDAGLWIAPRQPADPALDARLAERCPDFRYLMSNLLGFGGGHTSLILERCR